MVLSSSTVTVNGSELRFCESDIVNPEEWIPADDGYNPHRVRPWLLHDHGFTVAVVFASNESDALDIAADAGRLDRFQIDPADESDYGPDGDGITALGNAGEPFDIESLGMVELPNPSRSLAAAFVAAGLAQWTHGQP